MSEDRHGLYIGVERQGEAVFVFLKAIGRLTHADYDEIMPMIEAALAGVTHPRVHALVDATELEGWEPRALWDDFRLGLRHGPAFEKIAIWGDRRWQEWAARIGSWFVSGDVSYFTSRDEAVRWLMK